MSENKFLEIGLRIKAIREELVLSPAEFSKLSGVHVTTLFKIETGKTKHLREKTVRKMASACGMVPGDFARAIGYYASGTTHVSSPSPLVKLRTTPKRKEGIADEIEVESQKEAS